MSYAFVVFVMDVYILLCLNFIKLLTEGPMSQRGRRGRDHIVVGLTTTYAISAYHH
jgi:hypothetical protein